MDQNNSFKIFRIVFTTRKHNLKFIKRHSNLLEPHTKQQELSRSIDTYFDQQLLWRLWRHTEGLNDRHYNKLESVFLELESESATTLPRDGDVGVSIIVNGKVTQVWEGRDLPDVKVGSLLLM